jgi:hypothetical protein
MFPGAGGSLVTGHFQYVLGGGYVGKAHWARELGQKLVCGWHFYLVTHLPPGSLLQGWVCPASSGLMLEPHGSLYGAEGLPVHGEVAVPLASAPQQSVQSCLQHHQC